MKSELLAKIADVINESSTHFRALVPYCKREYMAMEGQRLVKQDCYVLKIWQAGKITNHVKRSEWNIFERDLDKIITKISRRDLDFADRMSACAPTRRDVECLVRRASFRSLRLKIVESAFCIDN